MLNAPSYTADDRRNQPIGKIAHSFQEQFDKFVTDIMSKNMRRRMIDSKIFTITPEIAQHILTTYPGENRKISKIQVDRLANAIKQNNWQLTHQGININSQGALDDGQHRLTAIIQADIPVKMFVTVGTDPKAFEVFDSGRKRTGGDALSVIGYKNVNALSAMVSSLIAVSRGSLSNLTNWQSTSPEIIEFLRHNPDATSVLDDASLIRRHLSVPEAGLGAALFLITHDTKHIDRYNQFVLRLADGTNLSPGSPILVLRNYILRRLYQENSTRAARVQLMSSVIKAWNAFVCGKSVSHFARRNTSSLPVIK